MLPSNKTVRIVSTHAFKQETKCTCWTGSGVRHFEEGKGGMRGNIEEEPDL